MLRLSQKLFRKPRTTVRGSVGTGWVGLLLSWFVLGGGVTLAVVSIAGFFSVDQGVCEQYADDVCQVANLGGLGVGLVGIAGAVFWSIMIARGFGPPAAWWALPAVVGGTGAAVFLDAVAGQGVVEPLKIVVSLLLIAAAGGIVMLIMPQRERAFAGWTRLDGLDAEEARMRGSDALVLPAAAAVAAGAGGALALHMFGQLTTN